MHDQHSVEQIIARYPVAQLAPGEMATVIAEVRSAKLAGFRRKDLGLFEARLE